MKKTIVILGLAALVIVAAGCASTPAVSYGSPDQVETVTTDFGSTDLQMIAEKMVNSLLASPILASGKQPVFYVQTVRNRTDEHIDTKAVTDKIRVTLLRSGKVKFTAIAEVKDLAARSGLEIRAISYPQQSLTDYGLVRRSFVFGVEGSYGALRQLVYLLELTPSFLTLESIRVGEVGTGGQLRAELSLSTLFVAEPEPAGKGRS